MSGRYHALIGATPARNVEDVLATLTRLRRELDIDPEEAQSRGYQANAITFANLELLDALRDYVRPAVEELARWRAEDRLDEDAKGFRLALDQPRPRSFRP